MTFGDDSIRLMDPEGERFLCCASLDFDWPPPEKIEVTGRQYRRIRFSNITDDERAESQVLVRIAVYEPGNANEDNLQ